MRCDLAARNRYEGRAEAFDAAIILVAGRLVDRALAAEFGFQRRTLTQFDWTEQSPQPSQTSLVDEHPLAGIGIGSPLAAAALLGRAGLVIDDRGHALLSGGAPSAVHPSCPDGGSRPYRGSFAPENLSGSSDTRRTGETPSAHKLIDHVDRRNMHLDRLAARHRDRVVEQDLEASWAPGRPPLRGSQENARVGIGAVAHVLEDVWHIGELADRHPRHAIRRPSTTGIIVRRSGIT